jgi:hypothetical protein
VTRAIALILLLLALVVVTFVATWLTIPGGRYETKNLTTGRWETGRITYPARFFRVSLVERDTECARFAPSPPEQLPGSTLPTREERCLSEVIYHRVDLHTVRQRVVIAYSGLAVAIILIGLALGALFRRSTPPPSPSAGSV